MPRACDENQGTLTSDAQMSLNLSVAARTITVRGLDPRSSEEIGSAFADFVRPACADASGTTMFEFVYADAPWPHWQLFRDGTLRTPIVENTELTFALRTELDRLVAECSHRVIGGTALRRGMHNVLLSGFIDFRLAESLLERGFQLTAHGIVPMTMTGDVVPYPRPIERALLPHFSASTDDPGKLLPIGPRFPLSRADAPAPIGMILCRAELDGNDRGEARSLEPADAVMRLAHFEPTLRSPGGHHTFQGIAWLARRVPVLEVDESIDPDVLARMIVERADSA